jgi:hypothetical protein
MGPQVPHSLNENPQELDALITELGIQPDREPVASELGGANVFPLPSPHTYSSISAEINIRRGDHTPVVPTRSQQ